MDTEISRSPGSTSTFPETSSQYTLETEASESGPLDETKQKESSITRFEQQNSPENRKDNHASQTIEQGGQGQYKIKPLTKKDIIGYVFVTGFFAAIVAIGIVIAVFVSENNLNVDGENDDDGIIPSSAVRQTGQTDAEDNILKNLTAPPVLSKELDATFVSQDTPWDHAIDVQGTPVNYRQAVPLNNAEPLMDIFLMNDVAHTAETWLRIRTLQNLANWGYRAVAIDLPRREAGNIYVTNVKLPTSAEDKSKFLASAIAVLNMTLDKLVIISPGSSGSYALPYLFSGTGQSTEKAKGFVTVMPYSGTGEYVAKFKESQLPSLIVFCSQDSDVMTSLSNMKKLPVKYVAEIPQRTSVSPQESPADACYIQNTTVWHLILYNWLINTPASKQ